MKSNFIGRFRRNCVCGWLNALLWPRDGKNDGPHRGRGSKDSLSATELRAHLLLAGAGWVGEEMNLLYSSVGARGSAKCEVVVENHHCEIAEIHVPSDEKKRICKVP